MIGFISRYWDSYLIGLGLAIVISAASMATSITFGLLLALGRQSDRELIRVLTSGYVAMFRALPPLLTFLLRFFCFADMGCQRPDSDFLRHVG